LVHISLYYHTRIIRISGKREDTEEVRVDLILNYIFIRKEKSYKVKVQNLKTATVIYWSRKTGLIKSYKPAKVVTL
jgi:hypothetical protein